MQYSDFALLLCSFALKVVFIFKPKTFCVLSLLFNRVFELSVDEAIKNFDVQLEGGYGLLRSIYSGCVDGKRNDDDNVHVIFDTTAMIVSVANATKRKPFYCAVPEPNSKLKVIYQPDEELWYCPKTDSYYTGCKHVYCLNVAIQDTYGGTGRIYTTLFGASAKFILNGIDANVLAKYYNENNFAEINKILNTCCYNTFRFRLKAKIVCGADDFYRLQFACIALHPINWEKENNLLLKKLDIVNAICNKI